MRVMILGGDGYLGWPTAMSFSRAGHRVAVIDNFAMSPNTRAGDLSHGQRAGLHLAMTLASDPELLVLDDPAVLVE